MSGTDKYDADMDKILDLIKDSDMGPSKSTRTQTYRSATASLGRDDEGLFPVSKSEAHSISYKWEGPIPDGVDDVNISIRYAEVYLALLAQRVDVFSGVFDLPRCYFSGFFTLDKNMKHRNAMKIFESLDKRDHRPYFADKDRIISVGAVYVPDTVFFTIWWDVIPYVSTEKIYLLANAAVFSKTDPGRDFAMDIAKSLIDYPIPDCFSASGPPTVHNTFAYHWIPIQWNCEGPALAAHYAERASITQAFLHSDKAIKDLQMNKDFVKITEEISKSVFIQKVVRVSPPDKYKTETRPVLPGYITKERMADVFANVILRKEEILGGSVPNLASITQKADPSNGIYESATIGCQDYTSTDSDDTDDFLSEHVEKLLQSGRGLREYNEPDSCGEDL